MKRRSGRRILNGVSLAAETAEAATTTSTTTTASTTAVDAGTGITYQNLAHHQRLWQHHHHQLGSLELAPV